ncbi:MAG TPA: AI-2E family transporter [Candidatus Binatia bacterium]|nr:AI-2E family transporter [Candidatus Binatia bacterium]
MSVQSNPWAGSPGPGPASSDPLLQPQNTFQRQRRLPTLTVSVVSALVIALLYFAQAVLIPFALAVLLTFVLSPAVSSLQRIGASRAAAVTLVIVLAFCAVAGAGWVVTAQIGTLAAELPKYRSNIAEKARYVRSMGKGGVLENVQETVKDLQTEFEGEERLAPGKSSRSANPPSTATWPSFELSSMLRTTGMATLMLGLVIFMLAQREELRNRLIRVIGYAHLTVTTRALDDAGRRISNYLLMQITINGCFGLVVAIALFLIGLPYAFLWGFLAVPLLFIPVVGFWTAAALPTILALAVFREWWWPLVIVGLFFALKTVINMVLEPLLYGRSVGVFPVPLLMMIAFWTWLWGGIGLLLATPMTVCLVVFARHVPQLESVRVLLSDEAAMEPKISYYQRLLAMDANEATAILREYMRRHSREHVFDQLLLPALSYAKADLRNNKINEREYDFVITGSRKILEASAAFEDDADSEIATIPLEKIAVVGCPAQDSADELALLMLRRLLNPSRYHVEIIPAGTLTSEMAAIIVERKPPLVCVGAVSPGGLEQLRYICKRLRTLSAEVKIVAGHWGTAEESEAVRESLIVAGADQVGSRLCQTRDQITNLRPFLSSLSSESKLVSFASRV